MKEIPLLRKNWFRVPGGGGGGGEIESGVESVEVKPKNGATEKGESQNFPLLLGEPRLGNNWAGHKKRYAGELT